MSGFGWFLVGLVWGWFFVGFWSVFWFWFMVLLTAVGRRMVCFHWFAMKLRLYSEKLSICFLLIGLLISAAVFGQREIAAFHSPTKSPRFLYRRSLAHMSAHFCCFVQTKRDRCVSLTHEVDAFHLPKKPCAYVFSFLPLCSDEEESLRIMWFCFQENREPRTMNGEP